MHSIFGWRPPKRALADAIETLRRLPLDHASNSSGVGSAGWHMDIRGPSENVPARTRGHGIYATAFAVRLLCATHAPTESDKKYAIASGVRYLFGQIDDAEAVSLGKASSDIQKRGRKKKEFGITDIDLVLKIAQTLEAFNAVRGIQERDRVLLEVVDETRAKAQNLAKKLQGSSIDQDFQGIRQQCWPWHRLPNQRRVPHIIPTVQAACALLRYERNPPGVDVDRIVHYLNSELRRDPNAILPLRATAYNGIVEIEQLAERPLQRVAPLIGAKLEPRRSGARRAGASGRTQ